jgi:hypothetical protein
MRKTSYSFYLFALSIADLIVTLLGNIRLAIIHYNNYDTNKQYEEEQYLYDIREHSLIACRLHRFLTYYFLQLSSIILCLLNVERLFGCVLILKSSQFCTPSIARKSVLITCVLLLLVNLHFLIAMGNFDTDSISSLDLNTNTTTTIKLKQKCEPNPMNKEYIIFWQVFQLLDCTIYCIIPFAIMITCNFMIVSKIIRSRIRSRPIVVCRKNNTIINNSSKSMLANEKRISFILVGISVSFFLFTMPIFVIEYLDSEFNYVSNWRLVVALADMLMYLNHVINFFFYCLLGPKFRQQVKSLFICFKKNHKITNFNNNYNNNNNRQLVKLNKLDTSSTKTRTTLLMKQFNKNILLTTSHSVIMLNRHTSLKLTSTTQQQQNNSNNNENIKKSASVLDCSLLDFLNLTFLRRKHMTSSSLEFNI